MKKRLIDVECPFCHASFTMMKDTYLLQDGGLNKEEKALEEGLFFTHVCQSCHQTFLLCYPLIYRDVGRHFALVLAQGDPDLTHLEEKIVLCRTPGQFLFAWKILSQGMDLSKALQARAKLEKEKGAKAALISADGTQNQLCFQIGDQLYVMIYSC